MKPKIHNIFVMAAEYRYPIITIVFDLIRAQVSYKTTPPKNNPKLILFEIYDSLKKYPTIYPFPTQLQRIKLSQQKKYILYKITKCIYIINKKWKKSFCEFGQACNIDCD
ncbi:unnamed protein product [Paramecium octaurelia]|uniref:Uncharacterized protein n=1 Tax=Paramecium octaurelia TaxID=43137 RepID=A0A8S1X5B7_PAROT|nr:unnamed protein product [Paramecium octaurelia]